jgi:hypothetical protein
MPSDRTELSETTKAELAINTDSKWRTLSIYSRTSLVMDLSKFVVRMQIRVPGGHQIDSYHPDSVACAKVVAVLKSLRRGLRSII